MAKTFRREADVKGAVKQILGSFGGDLWWYMPVPTGFGVQGVPDFICCLKGRFVAIETKYGNNGLTGWQIKQMQAINRANGAHFVIHEDNVADLENMLRAVVALEE